MNNQSIQAASSVGLSPVPPPSPVASTVNQLREAQSRTHSLLDDLNIRLAPVLDSRTSPDGGAKAGEAYSGSPLTRDLQDRLDAELSIQSRLLMILEALTV